LEGDLPQGIARTGIKRDEDTLGAGGVQCVPERGKDKLGLFAVPTQKLELLVGKVGFTIRHDLIKRCRMGGDRELRWFDRVSDRVLDLMIEDQRQTGDAQHQQE